MKLQLRKAQVTVSPNTRIYDADLDTQSLHSNTNNLFQNSQKLSTNSIGTESLAGSQQLYSWGLNKDGELSLAQSVEKNDEYVTIPQKAMGVPHGSKTSQVASGGHHSALLTNEGQLFICGSYLHGKLGIDKQTSLNVHKFKAVTRVKDYKVQQVVCGDYHTVALLSDGSLHTWGGSLNSKLGKRQSMINQMVPGLVTPLKSKTITAVACGDFHTLALEETGVLWVWGGGAQSYNRGQCGIGNFENVPRPTQVKHFDKKPVRLIAAGGYHSLAVTEDNELYGWGSSIYGETGTGLMNDFNSPKAAEIQFEDKEALTLNGSDRSSDPDDVSLSEESKTNNFVDAVVGRTKQIVQVAAGGHHSMILTKEGYVYAFGFGAHGQLGLPGSTNYIKPTLVKSLARKRINKLACGWNHSLVLTNKGQVYTAGLGKQGQLGHGDTESKTVFQVVEQLRLVNVVDVFAGGNHSWAATERVYGGGMSRFNVFGSSHKKKQHHRKYKERQYSQMEGLLEPIQQEPHFANLSNVSKSDQYAKEPSQGQEESNNPPSEPPEILVGSDVDLKEKSISDEEDLEEVVQKDKVDEDVEEVIEEEKQEKLLQEVVEERQDEISEDPLDFISTEIEFTVEVKKSMTQLSHKFLRCEVKKDKVSEFNVGLKQALQKIEANDSIHYVKWKQDSDVVDNAGTVISTEAGDNGGLNHTFMLVTDPLDFAESVILSYSELSVQERQKIQWAKLIYDQINSCVEGKLRFLDLHP